MRETAEMTNNEATSVPMGSDPVDDVWDFHEDSLVIRLGDQFYVFRGFNGFRSDGPWCVSSSSGPTGRCEKSVRNGDHHGGWSEWVVAGTEGKLYVQDPGKTKAESFIKQRCAEHLDADTPNAIEPTWTLFDPAKDADLLRWPRVPTWTPQGLRSIVPAGAPPEWHTYPCL